MHLIGRDYVKHHLPDNISPGKIDRVYLMQKYEYLAAVSSTSNFAMLVRESM